MGGARLNIILKMFAIVLLLHSINSVDMDFNRELCAWYSRQIFVVHDRIFGLCRNSRVAFFI